MFLWPPFWTGKQRRHNWLNSAAVTVFENLLNIKYRLVALDILDLILIIPLIKCVFVAAVLAGKPIRAHFGKYSGF